MENKIENQERTFPLLKILKRNWLLMAMITVLITMLLIAYSLCFTKPVYTATRSFILRTELVSGGTNMSNGALAVDVLLPQIEDNFTSQKYNDMANYKYFNDKDGENDKYIKYNNTAISRGAISFEYSQGSLIAKLSYTDTDAKVAVEKLKAVFDTANEFFSQVESNQDAYTIELIPTDNTEYDDSRFVITENSSLKKFVIIGVVAGVFVAFAVVLIKNALDTTVKDRQELEEITGTNLLATIDKQ